MSLCYVNYGELWFPSFGTNKIRFVTKIITIYIKKTWHYDDNYKHHKNIITNIKLKNVLFKRITI